MNLTLRKRLDDRLANFPIKNREEVLDAVFDEAKKDITLLWTVLDAWVTKSGKYPAIPGMQDGWDAANMVRQQYDPR